MRTPLYQLDAFASCLFQGNPAAVMPMKHFPSDATMLAIAEENNLSETAFLVPEGGEYRLRWFTPRVEVPLCGHATLASAAVVMKRLEPGRTRVVFQTASGALTVRSSGEAYVMDLPARPSQQIAPPLGLAEALRTDPLEVWANDFNYLAVLQSADAVRRLAPDMARIAEVDRPGVIVSAAGDGVYDCVSRYFAPRKGIPEDPVTGAAHCMLAPYWAARLRKAELRAFQASRRSGEMLCRVMNDRVELEAFCVFYLEGAVELDEL